ncbi:uncharacterized protein ColSpa_12509 [Colletotrichum spaethianum]|uniref:Uncharacterized protein n=1 Tax=Colletotrichum spaethianum TaxID=700344 RepID=A0AA37PHA7_9PEZI|nr:uncharacterized protein ColSpa_12509 [Colletotrichum spaethianum]GKT52328.1 hypothetical protein ColSpa_12509 [Colletotrichum spaethianum]
MFAAGLGSSALVALPPRPTCRANHSIDWRLGDGSERLILQKVDTITDLVYDRLLTRGGFQWKCKDESVLCQTKPQMTSKLRLM